MGSAAWEAILCQEVTSRQGEYSPQKLESFTVTIVPHELGKSACRLYQCSGKRAVSGLYRLVKICGSPRGNPPSSPTLARGRGVRCAARMGATFDQLPFRCLDGRRIIESPRDRDKLFL